VIPWKLSRLDELLQREDVTEARVIAALLMTQRLMDR
jgi:ADP-ribose diphosphatase